MSHLFYFFKEAVRGFYEAKLMTFVSVLTIAMALFFAGVITITYGNARVWLNRLSSQVDVVAFVSDLASADSAVLDRIAGTIRMIPGASGVTLIDKKEAWKHFEASYGQAMLSAVDENPFPASFEIVLDRDKKNIAGSELFIAQLKQIDGIEDCSSSRLWFSLIDRFRTYFIAGTVVVVVILMLTLHFMISNTIKLTIYARKELVRNMHFVGATDFYIQMPFILEGILQGIVGACLALIGLTVIKIPLAHTPIVWYTTWLFPLIAVLGVVFGWQGSARAVRRFLV